MTRPSSKKPSKANGRSSKEYIKFILVAAVLMFVVDGVLWHGERPYVKKIKDEYYARAAKDEPAEPPKMVYPDDGSEYFEAPLPVEEKAEEPPKAEDHSSNFVEEEWDVVKTPPKPQKQAKQIPPKAYEKPKFSGEKAKIAIVIDDVGMNLPESHKAIDLPPEVTLAFLPYAKNVRELSDVARQKGHEMIIHAPMEAISNKVDLGSIALRSGMDYATFDKEFKKMADSFNGFVGINNHMGSKLTQDPEAMGFLMDELKRRGLYFLDSKTIATSIAAQTAKTYGIPFAERDVFLDHVETPEFTAGALEKLERIAKEQGSAIAIGHPKEITMQALQAWIPTLEEKGIELVTVSSLLDHPEENKKIVENHHQTEQPVILNDVAPATGAPTNLIFSPPQPDYLIEDKITE